MSALPAEMVFQLALLILASFLRVWTVSITISFSKLAMIRRSAPSNISVNVLSENVLGKAFVFRSLQQMLALRHRIPFVVVMAM